MEKIRYIDKDSEERLCIFIDYVLVNNSVRMINTQTLRLNTTANERLTLSDCLGSRLCPQQRTNASLRPSRHTQTS